MSPGKAASAKRGRHPDPRRPFRGCPEHGGNREKSMTMTADFGERAVVFKRLA